MLRETPAHISVRKQELKTFQSRKAACKPPSCPTALPPDSSSLSALAQVWMSSGDGGHTVPTRSPARRPAQGPPQPATPLGLPRDTHFEKPRCRTLPVRAAQGANGGRLICRYLSSVGWEGVGGAWLGYGLHVTTKMGCLSHEH